MSLQITGMRSADTNVLLVSVTLSNGASHTLNIVDSVNGGPAYYLDAGLEYGLGIALGGDGGNQLKLNLKPGATLTNTIWITNPPPRFRVKVPIRDLNAEPRHATNPAALVLHIIVQRLVGWRIIRLNLPGPAMSAWVHASMPTEPIWEEIGQLRSLRERALHSAIPVAAKILSDACNVTGAAGCRDPYLVHVYTVERTALVRDVVKYLRQKTGEDLGADPQKWISKYAQR